MFTGRPPAPLGQRHSSGHNSLAECCQQGGGETKEHTRCERVALVTLLGVEICAGDLDGFLQLTGVSLDRYLPIVIEGDA
jgi:hypothetical protein